MVFDDRSLAPYRGREPYIFISYSHRNADRAAAIISRLNRTGFRVWYDEGLIPGREWDENIARIIMSCGFFVALITEEYLASANCRDELNFARDKNKPLLLIYLDEVALPAGMELRLGRLYAVHQAACSSEEVFFSKIFAADGIARCNRQYTGAASPRTSAGSASAPHAAYASASSTGFSGSGASPAPSPASRRREQIEDEEEMEDDEETGSGAGSALPVLGVILLLLLAAAAVFLLYRFNASGADRSPAPPPQVQSPSPSISNEAELDIEATPTPDVTEAPSGDAADTGDEGMDPSSSDSTDPFDAGIVVTPVPDTGVTPSPSSSETTSDSASGTEVIVTDMEPSSGTDPSAEAAGTSSAAAAATDTGSTGEEDSDLLLVDASSS